MNISSREILFEGTVLAVQDSDEGTVGWVEYEGVRLRVNLSLVPSIRVGERVVVCGRMALSRVEEESG